MKTPAFRWWEVKDGGGFPPFWPYGMPQMHNDKTPWPSEWYRRPHP